MASSTFGAITDSALRVATARAGSRGKRRQLDGLWYYLADTEGLEDAAHGPMQRRMFARG